MSSEYDDLVCVVDTSWVMKKYYFALGTKQIELSNGEKKPVGHLISCLKTAALLFNKQKADKVFFVEDRKTMLRKIDGEYKINRTRNLGYDVYKDIDFIRKIVYDKYEDGKVSFIYADGMEADWVMYTIAKQREKKNKRTIIYTKDNDLYQCLNENRKTVIYQGLDNNKDVYVNFNIYMNEQEIINKYRKVNPEKLAIYRSFIGDRSDNIKGIKRIPKDLVAYITNNLEFEDIYKGDEVFIEKVRNSISNYEQETCKSYMLWLEEIINFRETFFNNIMLSKLYEIDNKYIKKINKEDIKIKEEEYQAIYNRIRIYI